LAAADLAIFEYTVPKDLPPVNSLLVMPPAADPVFDFTTTAAAPLQIAGWRNTDPLTDSVNFRLLALNQAELFGVHPWMAPVISGDQGALLLQGDRADHRYLAAGFNPFPYLGRRNLPMSVLTLNLLGYLAGLGASGRSYQTGEPWLVPAGVERIVMPSGHAVRAAPGTLFTGAAFQGLYRLEGGGAKTLRAVNLDNLTVSDLENAPPLKLEPRRGGEVEAAPVLEQRPLSSLLLAIILGLAALEAFAVYRRRRRISLAA
ncbi:MAG TPA: hypothetical protein VEJ86_10325, partial [Candidatus Binataceae bacterium]|nr:hypothetical protein [Candidatus Binataceae bacterium]